MARYAIAFDLDTTAMDEDGMTDAEKTQVYQTEVPEALNQCGFTDHLQGSLYATETKDAPIKAILQLQSILQQEAPNFCRYADRIHIFRLEDWSDVTDIIGTSPADSSPVAEKELEEQQLEEAASSS
jgi:virulence-associated protein VapD